MAAAPIIEIQPIILDVACFHCRQAIEKYFNAFLIPIFFNWQPGLIIIVKAGSIYLILRAKIQSV